MKISAVVDGFRVRDIVDINCYPGAGGRKFGGVFNGEELGGEKNVAPLITGIGTERNSFMTPELQDKLRMLHINLFTLVDAKMLPSAFRKRFQVDFVQRASRAFPHQTNIRTAPINSKFHPQIILEIVNTIAVAFHEPGIGFDVLLGYDLDRPCIVWYQLNRALDRKAVGRSVYFIFKVDLDA